MTLRGLRGNLMGVIVDVKLRAVGSYHSLGNGSGDLLDGATPGRSKIERKSFSMLLGSYQTLGYVQYLRF